MLTACRMQRFDAHRNMRLADGLKSLALQRDSRHAMANSRICALADGGRICAVLLKCWRACFDSNGGSVETPVEIQRLLHAIRPNRRGDESAHLVGAGDNRCRG